MFKRITAIALALVICAAAAFLGCQPTPDHDIIVNRGDDDNIGGASTPTKAPEGKPGEPIITPEPVVKIEVPEHLSILENTSEDVYIKIETDVTADLSGKLPTLAIRPVDTRDNPDFVNRMLALLSLQGDYYKEWDMSVLRAGRAGRAIRTSSTPPIGIICPSFRSSSLPRPISPKRYPMTQAAGSIRLFPTAIISSIPTAAYSSCISTIRTTAGP